MAHEPAAVPPYRPCVCRFNDGSGGASNNAVLRIGAIPDQDPEKLTRLYAVTAIHDLAESLAYGMSRSDESRSGFKSDRRN